MTPRTRVAIAWVALILAGTAMALTGQLTWHMWWAFGPVEVYGEYVVEFIALGMAGFTLLACGLRSPAEILAARVTIVLALLSPVTTAWSANWYWTAELLLHLSLAAQLANWCRTAALADKREAWPVGLMAGGMLVESGNVAYKLLFAGTPPDCDATLWLTCVASEYAAMALPMLVTLAMLPWFAGLGRWAKPS